MATHRHTSQGAQLDPLMAAIMAEQHEQQNGHNCGRPHKAGQPLDNAVYGVVAEVQDYVYRSNPACMNPFPHAGCLTEMRVGLHCCIEPALDYDVMDADKWNTSKISAALGFPLKVRRWYKCNCSPKNEQISQLFIVADTNDEAFGTRKEADAFIGDSLVVRTDGHDIKDNLQFQGLIAYIHRQLIPLVTHKGRGCCDLETAIVWENEAHWLSVKKEIVKKVTPEAFHAFYEEYRRMHIAEAGDEADDVAISPVLLAHPNIGPACGTCGQKSEEGHPLLSCGKCQVRHYCSKECQKKDWKQHKKCCGVGQQ